MIVAIEKQNDGTYIAYNTEGEKFTAIGSGTTIKEAKEDFFNSIEEMKVIYQEHGDEIPAELLDAPIFRIDLPTY